jgi:hypothetical protein
MEIIRGAKKSEGSAVWEGGKILDPENGKEYTLRMTPLEDGKKLQIRGYIGPFYRTQTQIWTRVQRVMDTLMKRFQVKKVAVLGAGVMGAQIAAHLVNVKVPVVLFDLPAKEGAKNGIVTRAIDNLKKLKPSPLGVASDADLIGQANYEEHLEQLRGCDLIIEAIAERMDWKLDLYKKIAPFVADHAIVASNTSGLSITKLSEGLPEAIKPRFCGIHFFNPPRYMTLVELINTPTTEPRSSTTWRPSSPAAWARAWCAPRTRPTSWPTASASPACWPR